MSTPPDITAERLDELVAGSTPGTDAERAMVALLTQVRDAEPGAPDRLRTAVDDMARAADGAAGAETRRGHGWRALRARLAGTRRVRPAILAPALAVVLAAVLVVPLALRQGDTGTPMSAVSDGAAEIHDEPAAPAPDSRLESDGDLRAAPDPASPQAPGAREARGGAEAIPGGVPVPDGGRSQQVSTWTRVHVADVAALSEASASAMATVRSLGGFTADSEYRVPHAGSGSHRLVFRVPVARVGEAVEAFGRLGTVIGQEAEIVDVTARITAADTAIARLSARVEALRARLADAPDDATLRAQLTRLERTLATHTANRATTVERSRLATVRLALTTDAPAAAPEDEGAIAAALSDAFDRLNGALAAVIGAAVLWSPLILALAVAIWLANRRRRATARLLHT